MLRAISRNARDFGRREDGGLILFALFVLVIMLFTGGMAVDMMRYESARSRVQGTSDTAVLAAASMRQVLNAEDVITDYFDKAGLADNLVAVSSDDGLNYRTARVDTAINMRPYFMHMMGINRLNSSGASAALERRTNVEIAMVLDVSGSMINQPSRITNLKEAAAEFVEQLLADDTENRVSISMVPYNGQVILSQSLLNRFNVTLPNGEPNANCLQLATSTYNSLSISRTDPIPMAGYADTFSNSYSGTTTPNTWLAPTSTSARPTPGNIWCNPRLANRIRVHQNDVDTMVPAVNALEAVGATSIDLGLKWGAYLLDPSSRQLVAELAALGEVPGHFVGRPFDYDDPEALKVVVLMTDGEHFAEERLNDAYKSGLSPIYRSTGDGNYSIHHPTWTGSSNKYWTPHRNNGAGEWRSAPWDSGSGVVQLTWPQVWKQQRVKWVAWQLYARALGNSNNTARTNMYNTWVNNFRSLTPTAEMDQRLLTLCNEVKSRKIVIFGIAFEADPGGINVLRNCSSPDRFYDVQGLEIRTAFRQIRSQISSLRLTQ
ncbi:MAG: pilus assembly protein TadG-related protein [Gemmobacter sp.]